MLDAERQFSTTPRTNDWRLDTVGYEVYLQSFADSDGVGVVADYGYDVGDDCAVDPLFADRATASSSPRIRQW